MNSLTVDYNRFGYHQIGWQRYGLLCVAVFAQLATILITWQLWEIRIEPPNLPVLALPPFPFGVLLLVSLVGLLIDPLRGFVLHVVLLIMACLLDQYRMQPQFLANIILMLATLGRRGQLVGYWFLAAMWFWAGLHKLISPDWFAHASYWILSRAGISREFSLAWFKVFAGAVIVSEIGLGILALIRPRLAAYGCVLLHVGIPLMLLSIEWNYSVIPWNLATAVVGFWLLGTWPEKNDFENGILKRRSVFQTVVAILCFVPPIGFYYGLFDHGYANVLYSDFLPRASITGKDELRTIRGWDVVNVPFPSERRTLRQFFESVSSPGDKLHLRDPRPALPDQHFVLSPANQAIEISVEEFFSSSDHFVAGIGLDDRYSSFHLRQWGEITRRYYHGNDSSEQNEVSFAYTFSPEHYLPKRLKFLAGLPNLEELQLKGCPVEDDDLKYIGSLTRLTGIGLMATGVTDEGLKYLADMPRLEIVETENTRISPAGLQWLKQRLNDDE